MCSSTGNFSVGWRPFIGKAKAGLVALNNENVEVSFPPSACQPISTSTAKPREVIYFLNDPQCLWMLRTKQLLSRGLGSFPLFIYFRCLGFSGVPRSTCWDGPLDKGWFWKKACLQIAEWKESLVGAKCTWGQCLGEVRCGDTQSWPLIFLASPSCMAPDKSRNHSEPQSPPLKLVTMPIYTVVKTECSDLYRLVCVCRVGAQWTSSPSLKKEKLA